MNENGLIDYKNMIFKGEEELTLCSYKGSDPQPVVPEQVNGKPVRIIGASAFFSSEIQGIILPGGLKRIEKQAFKFCMNLKNLELPKSLLYIGDEAFYDCTLEELYIPASVMHIGTDALTIGKARLGNRGIKMLRIDPENRVYQIQEKGLFQQTEDGKRLLQLVESIGESYRVPEGTTHIGNHVFSYNLQLKRVQLPDELREIGDYAFYYCGLEEANLPKGLVRIGEYAFYTTKIHRIKLPQTLAYLGKSALSTKLNTATQTRELTEIMVEAGNPKYSVRDNALYERAEDGIRLVLYFGVAKVFAVPYFVTIICEGAFTHALVEEVHLHRDIERIETDAFLQCKTLQKLFVERKDQKDCESVMLYIPTLEAVYDDINAYLNCIHYQGDGEMVDLEEYDRLFPIIRDMEEKLRVALTRLDYPCGLTDRARENYTRYLLDNFRLVSECLIDSDDAHGMSNLIKLRMLSSDRLEDLIALAIEREALKVTALFLEYKRKNYGYEQTSYDL